MKIQFSRDFGESDDFLLQILEIDSLVYESELQGTFKSVSERYHKNRDSFILAVEESFIIGYFCFFPISDELVENMKIAGTFYDDNIRPRQILQYTNSNDIFLISTAVRPEFQDGQAIRLLTQGFKVFVCEKKEEGKLINSFNAYISSPGGAKLAARFGMRKMYDIGHSYSFYRANRESVEEFCHG